MALTDDRLVRPCETHFQFWALPHHAQWVEIIFEGTIIFLCPKVSFKFRTKVQVFKEDHLHKFELLNFLNFL